MATTGNGANIFRVCYSKTSAIAADLGITINEGDNLTEAQIIAASGVTWQQIQVANDVSKFVRTIEPLTQAQFGANYKDDISRIGFEKPEGQIDYIHHPLFPTTHETVLENGLGTKVAHGITADTVNGSTFHSNILTQTGTNIVIGDIGKYIKISGQIARITAVATNTITLNAKISAIDGDAIVGIDSWNLQELTNDDSFVIFIEASNGNYFCTHCRFGIDLDVSNNDFLKWMINFQGDKAVPCSTLNFSNLGTSVTAEVIPTTASISNFSGVYFVDETEYCVHTFKPKVTREMTRKGSAATQSRNGNGGTFRDKFTTELSVTMYSNSLDTQYRANTQIPVFAQRPDFAIDAQKSLIRSVNENVITDNQNVSELTLAMNTDMSTNFVLVV